LTNIETRAALETRAEGRKLVGYAAVYDSETRISDFTETIRRGAFTASLANGADKLALVDHDNGKVLARTKSGTLRLSEDERGLQFEIDVPQTTLGNDILAMATRGDLGGASFAFTVADGGESWSGDRRELRSVNLHEVSVVQSFAAYSATSVSVRSRQNRSAAQRRIALLEMEAPHVAV
jgi:HK97 family phage prohead protease